MNTILISIDELWLKKTNRPFYFKALTSHIKEVLSYYSEKFSCKNEHQRILIQSESELPEECLHNLAKIPGISKLSPSYRVESYEEIFPLLQREVKKHSPSRFRIHTKRSDKNFFKKSMEVSQETGAFILEKFPSLKVDLVRPEMTFYITIVKDGIHLFTEKIPGMGGLPWGTSGHVITLLSGGFDSPVAAYLMAGRGCRQTFVFFYSYPFVGEEVKDKIIDLSSTLACFQKETKLIVVPFGDLQSLITKKCKPEYRTILFRRYMIECANLLADEYDADALATGDSLGQVSSQTIHNLSAMDKSSSRTILRPLIGMNKQGIMDLATQIGTYSISLRPHDDACSLFAVRHPVLHPDPLYWDQASRMELLMIEAGNCMEKKEIYTFDSRGKLVTTTLET